VRWRRWGSEQAISASHPYETPEIVLLLILAGSQRYLSWISELTSQP
jgi:uncharacterized protein involved in tolerance to divalent cations